MVEEPLQVSFGDPFTGGKVLAAIELLPGETLDVAVPR